MSKTASEREINQRATESLTNRQVNVIFVVPGPEVVKIGPDRGRVQSDLFYFLFEIDADPLKTGSRDSLFRNTIKVR